jgi:hypothetical protein
MALNRARVTNPIGLSTDLNYVVDVEFFDSVDPATILWRESFTVPLGATTGQLQAVVVKRGQEIRAALAAQLAAQQAVPNGTTVTVP